MIEIVNYKYVKMYYFIIKFCYLVECIEVCSMILYKNFAYLCYFNIR